MRAANSVPILSAVDELDLVGCSSEHFVSAWYQAAQERDCRALCLGCGHERRVNRNELHVVVRHREVVSLMRPRSDLGRKQVAMSLQNYAVAEGGCGRTRLIEGDSHLVGATRWRHTPDAGAESGDNERADGRGRCRVETHDRE